MATTKYASEKLSIQHSVSGGGDGKVLNSGLVDA